MNEQGLWKLFLRTGLPEAYLAIREAREDHRTPPDNLPAMKPPETKKSLL